MWNSIYGNNRFIIARAVSVIKYCYIIVPGNSYCSFHNPMTVNFLSSGVVINAVHELPFELEPEALTGIHHVKEYTGCIICLIRH